MDICPYFDLSNTWKPLRGKNHDSWQRGELVKTGIGNILRYLLSVTQNATGKFRRQPHFPKTLKINSKEV